MGLISLFVGRFFTTHEADRIWDEPTKADEILGELRERNKKLYEFERMLAS